MPNNQREHAQHLIPLLPTIFQQLLAPLTTDPDTLSQPPIFVSSTQVSVSEDYCLEQQPV